GEDGEGHPLEHRRGNRRRGVASEATRPRPRGTGVAQAGPAVREPLHAPSAQARIAVRGRSIPREPDGGPPRGTGRLVLRDRGRDGDREEGHPVDRHAGTRRLLRRDGLARWTPTLGERRRDGSPRHRPPHAQRVLQGDRRQPRHGARHHGRARRPDPQARGSARPLTRWRPGWTPRRHPCDHRRQRRPCRPPVPRPGELPSGGRMAAPTTDQIERKHHVSTGQIVAFVFGIIIVVAIFVFAIPKFADYGAIWESMKTLTPLELWSLIAVMIFNLWTYWIANQAGLIGLGIWQSAVVTQTSTSVANTLPAGGALGIGVTAAMLNSWGVTAGEITLFVGVTGIWNIFAKLGLPVIALALLVLSGHV